MIPPALLRLVLPRRTIRPTRDGWWCILAAVGLGVGAVNSGNNLAYLLCSLLLGLITVSGMLSDLSMRGLRLTAALPDEVHAGRVAIFGARVINRRRRLPSWSVTLEVQGAPRRAIYLPRLEAGGERLCHWEATLPARGRQRLPGVRVSTRFPFGLFVKTGRAELDAEVLVYPAVGPVPPERLREVGAGGDAALRRRGRGHDLHDLRPYRAGDDPRLIHWPASAKTRALTVREMEEDTAPDARLVLEGTGATDAARLERGLSEAASVAVHLCRAGAGVELLGPGVFVPLGRGRGQERRLLTALALYAPPSGGVLAAASTGALREVRVRLE